MERYFFALACNANCSVELASWLLFRQGVERKEKAMLHYAVVFFVIALIAAVLGFRGVAGLSVEIGWLFAVLAIVFLVVSLLSGRGPIMVP